MIRKIKNLSFQIIESLIRNVSGVLGLKLREFYYARRFGKCGKNLRVDIGVVFEGIADIFIGDNVWIDKYCVLLAGDVHISKKKVTFKKSNVYIYKDGELHIGSNSHLSPQCVIQAYGGVMIDEYFTASSGCKIYSLSNDVNKCKMGTYFSEEIFYVKSQIVIGKNVWLGLNSIVLGGNIEHDSFIAPNSLVINNITKNSFVMGSPAVRIKDRFK